MEEKLNELKALLSEVYDLEHVAALLHWDQSTYMPKGGVSARGRQLAMLEKLAHEKMVDPKMGRLLDALVPYEESLPDTSDDASLIRVARRKFEKASRVPASFMAEFSTHKAKTYHVWTEARPANDFSMVQPYLEKTLEYSRKLADYFPGYEHIADPLIDYSDEGMKASTLRKLFADLRKELVPLVQAVTEQPPVDDSVLKQHYPEKDQWSFGVQVMEALGYDFNRGRQDKTHHPFMTKFSLGDVRITTRFKENDLSEALFSSIHEAGHAMYEQGIRMEYEGTPLAGGTSSGVHESQSRLWENIVGRSRPFWEHFYPKLQRRFPEQLKDVSLDTFHRAINKVQPSLIRTDADELTYNLHVMIRFDLELALLEGKLAVKDLPEAWRERYTSDLGVTPPDDRDGVLQDVHWHADTIGGVFQGYTIGNILSAQYYDAALNTHPEIPDQIRQGEFTALRGWLTENIYRHGSKFTTEELTKRATGSSLSIDPYVRYLKRKFGELYL
ncbi:carboxypeptidase M32 [Melghirimyces algeriensis]|uniref:Metal-dependent carboxypeptidase n=1 Tax=Melghirimyces algeriensis TaxID=910412 RepID=A0A521F2C2_9BACL|nr:carboxypeptidase M32 [Melghirimyces algeriensis]SMO90339.1 carboxypeptidase Taq [Melghirimyces algeriensis]